MIYSKAQWILIFFIYCFCGWIWETLYVSVKTRKLVNRGFLHGPWLPIYGSGAIIILFTTRPFRESDILIFLVGMLSATFLEYVTGAVMEKLFQMRYWDYSDMACNLNGYVCLPASLVWGIFSLVIVHILHPPVDDLVMQIPIYLTEILCPVLSILFAVDVTKSVQGALDLRAFMVKLTQNHELMESLEHRMDSVIVRLDQASEKISSVAERVEQISERLEGPRGIVASLREKNRKSLADVQNRIQESMSVQERERLEKIKKALIEIQEAIQKAEAERDVWLEKEYKRASSILKRNPSARSREFEKALEELKRLREENELKP